MLACSSPAQPHHSNGQTQEGRAYLLLGSASGPGTEPDWTVECDQAQARFGDVLNGPAAVDSRHGARWERQVFGLRQDHAYVRHALFFQQFLRHQQTEAGNVHAEDDLAKPRQVKEIPPPPATDVNQTGCWKRATEALDHALQDHAVPASPNRIRGQVRLLVPIHNGPS